MADKGMSPSDLRALLDQQIKGSVGLDNSDIATERQENWRYYNGEPFGNEQEGRSQVVSRDVMDTIEWMMPSIIEAFHSNDEPIQFEPRGPEDVEAAQQATDYVNYIYQNDNPGFTITYDWAKDGLVGKVGVVKHWWDVSEKVKEEEFSGLTEDELVLLAQDPEVTILSKEIKPGYDGAPTYSIRIRRVCKQGYVRIETVPPEEFGCAPRTKRLEDAPFCYHRRPMPRSDLIAMGYDRDVVDQIPADEDTKDTTVDSTDRYEDEGRLYTGTDRTDKAMQEVTVTECYIRVDYDGDGIAELRKVMLGGANNGTILTRDGEEANEVVDEVPLKVWSPIRMPHTLWGKALVDAVRDLQLLKSTVWRQMLDGMYRSINPRLMILDGQVNLDDLMTDRPGGGIRTKTQGAIAPLPIQWNGAQAFPMLEYIDRVRDARTGTGQSAMAMNPDALNNQAGADANSRMMTQAEARVKLIARVFAECAFKPLAKSILRTVVKHQDKPRMIRLRNKFVQIDPRSWNVDMDVSAKVGLGTGEKAQQVQLVSLLTQKQEQIILQAGPDNPLVGMQEYYNGLKELVRLGGLPSADPYFKDPSQQPPQPPKPPPPDPAMEKVKMEAQAKQAEMQISAQADQQKAQQDAQLQAMKMEQEFALKREQIAAEMQLKREQLQAELVLKREQMQAELQMKRELGVMGVQAKVATSVATSEVSPGGEPG